MISASHNPFADNGIKLFGPDGYKLSDDAEREIEALMDQPLDAGLAGPKKLGRTRRVDDSQSRYIEIAKATFPRRLNLSGMRIVIDCANGATTPVAPTLFRDWLRRPRWQPEPITLSGVTDCYQPAERQFQITRRCLEVALETRQPLNLITKNALILRDLDLLTEERQVLGLGDDVQLNELRHPCIGGAGAGDQDTELSRHSAHGVHRMHRLQHHPVEVLCIRAVTSELDIAPVRPPRCRPCARF